MNNDKNTLKVTSQSEFETLSQETLELCKQKPCDIEKVIENIFLLRLFFLQESIPHLGLSEKIFYHRKSIIEGLDKILEVVYSKERLQRFGVSSN
jgi:hypothetical protein